MAAKAGKKCVNVDEKWRYCSVCRRNHDEERKHIFTKQHKNRLSVILSKFTKKVEYYGYLHYVYMYIVY